jgi:hypothetical protein
MAIQMGDDAQRACSLTVFRYASRGNRSADAAPGLALLSWFERPINWIRLPIKLTFPGRRSG